MKSTCKLASAVLLLASSAAFAAPQAAAPAARAEQHPGSAAGKVAPAHPKATEHARTAAHKHALVAKTHSKSHSRAGRHA